ncbi:MAG: MFS transporter, partial [Steroidobacteraceae bacterium]|nr:MFS transporter [Steroidobacteraceae bacterium]MDW8260599.1 MFS transporter [Gammaproteobacteria bacterium]
MNEHFAAIPNSEYWVGLIQTMPGFWIVAFSPIAGWLADRYGRRTILLVAMVVYAVTGVAPFFLDDIVAILVTRSLVGMCESVVLTVTTTMLCDYFKSPVRERWLAAQTGLASLSALFIIWLGGVLGERFGWQGPFLAYLYSLVLALGVYWFTWEPEREAANPEPAAAGHAVYETLPWARMIGIIAVTLFGSVAFYSTITQNANALVALGVTNPARIGEYATIASLGVPIGTVAFWVLGRLPVAMLLALDFLLIGIGFWYMSAATTPLAYALAANVQQIGCGLVLPTLLVWATRGLAYRIRGRGVGLWQGAFGIGLFISAAVLTWLGQRLGGLLPAFAVMAQVCVVLAALALGAQLFARLRPVRA